jgi:hypothetical protein
LDLLHLHTQFFSTVLPAHSGPRPFIQLRNNFFTDGRTPWTSDQPVARTLPKHRTTQTQNKRIHTPNIHALNGIGTHDPNVRASEDSLCLRKHGYCDRLTQVITSSKSSQYSQVVSWQRIHNSLTVTAAHYEVFIAQPNYFLDIFLDLRLTSQFYLSAGLKSSIYGLGAAVTCLLNRCPAINYSGFFVYKRII